MSGWRKKKPADPAELLKRMAGLCARSEQCRFDIDTKLFKAGLNKEQRAEILDYLVEHRYIDESRYARLTASHKVRYSGWGRRKIRVALAAKRIGTSDIEAAIESIDEEEYEAAFRRVAAAALKELDVSDPTQRASFYRRMMSRGFETDLINKALQ